MGVAAASLHTRIPPKEIPVRISIFIDLASQQVTIETESDLGETAREELAVDTTTADGPDADGFYPLIDTQEATHG